MQTVKPKIPARKWRNAVDEAQRECKAAGVPYVLAAINPDNKTIHGGYDGPTSAISGILSAVDNNVRGEIERKKLLFDKDGQPVYAGQGGSTNEVPTAVHGISRIRRLAGRWFGSRKV